MWHSNMNRITYILLLYLFWQKREYLQYALVRSYVRFLIKRILWNKIFLERKLFIVILIYSRIMSVKSKEIFMFVLSTTLSYSMWVKYLRFNIECILYYNTLIRITMRKILILHIMPNNKEKRWNRFLYTVLKIYRQEHTLSKFLRHSSHCLFVKLLI